MLKKKKNPKQKIDMWTSLVAQSVKNQPAMQDTQVWFLGQEDPLEEETATHSGILAWRIPWTYSPWGLQELDTAERLKHHHHHSIIN